MRFFSGATFLLKGATFIDFWFFKNFLRIFNFLFLWQCIKESNYLLFKRGLRLFKGLCLLFLPNVPGAMLIQGGTFIPDSRVCILWKWNVGNYKCSLKKDFNKKDFNTLWEGTHMGRRAREEHHYAYYSQIGVKKSKTSLWAK